LRFNYLEKGFGFWKLRPLTYNPGFALGEFRPPDSLAPRYANPKNATAPYFTSQMLVSKTSRIRRHQWQVSQRHSSIAAAPQATIALNYNYSRETMQRWER